MSTELLTGYRKSTQELAFRVYCTAIPETDRRQAHRIQHLAAWDLLGAALLRDFGLRHTVILRRGVEKPTLLRDFPQFNVSHCKGLAVCAVGSVPVGIDAEPPRAVRESMVSRICTAGESAWIAAQNDKMYAFSRIWTLKEAYTKYTGEGIRHPFGDLDFALEGGIRFQHPDAGKLRFFQLLRGNSHAVSLCVPEGDYDIQFHTDGWQMVCQKPRIT